jgi:hypothetical protein
LVFDWHSSASGSFAVSEVMAAIFPNQAGKRTHCSQNWEQANWNDYRKRGFLGCRPEQIVGKASSYDPARFNREVTV